MIAEGLLSRIYLACLRYLRKGSFLCSARCRVASAQSQVRSLPRRIPSSFPDISTVRSMEKLRSNATEEMTGPPGSLSLDSSSPGSIESTRDSPGSNLNPIVLDPQPSSPKISVSIQSIQSGQCDLRVLSGGNGGLYLSFPPRTGYTATTGAIGRVGFPY